MKLFEDIEIGEEASYGAYAVTEEEILTFARRYDPQPFHLDHEAAKKSHFGGLCASGWHTCAMAMRLITAHAATARKSIGGAGLEEVRWIKPVRPGHVLSVTERAIDKRQSEKKPWLGLVRFLYEIKNQDGELLATMDGWGMVATAVAMPEGGRP